MRRRVAVALLALGAALVVSACGSGGGSSTSNSSSAGAATAVRSDPATRSPVVLGFVDNTGEGEAFPEFGDAVRSTVQYLNAEAGGLQGHRVKVVRCQTDNTPQGAIRCANDLTSAHAVAVVAMEDQAADSGLPIYQQAGVPYLAPFPVTNQQFINPVSISLNPGIPGVWAALAKYVAGTLRGKKVVLIVEQGLPKSLLDQFVGQPMNAAGVKVTYAYFAKDNPDLTATFAAAAQQHPDVVIGDFDNNPQCIPAMKAAAQVGATFKVMQIRCNDDSVLKAAGSLANGELFYAFLDSEVGVVSRDSRTFDHIMQTYSTTKSNGEQAAAATATVMTLQRVLAHLGGNVVDRAGVLQAFRGSQGLSMFMGAPLTCGEVKVYPGLCSLAIRVFTAKDGEKKPLTGWYGAPQYLPKKS